MINSQNGFGDDYSLLVKGDVKNRSLALLWNLMKKSQKDVQYKFKNRRVTKMGILKNDHLSKSYDTSKEILSNVSQVNECLLFACYTSKKDFTSAVCNGITMMKYESGINGFLLDLHPDILIEEINKTSQNCWMVLFKCCVGDIGHLWDQNLVDFPLSKNANHKSGDLPTNMIITEKMITLGYGNICQCLPFAYIEFVQRTDTIPWSVHLLFHSVSPKTINQSYVSEFGISIERFLNENQKLYLEFIIICANLKELLKNLKMMHSQLLGKISYLNLIDQLAQNHFYNARHSDIDVPQAVDHDSMTVTFDKEIPVERAQNITESYILVEPEEMPVKNVSESNDGTNNTQIENQNTAESRNIMFETPAAITNEVINSINISDDIIIDNSKDMPHPVKDFSDLNYSFVSDVSESETEALQMPRLDVMGGVNADATTFPKNQMDCGLNEFGNVIIANKDSNCLSEIVAESLRFSEDESRVGTTCVHDGDVANCSLVLQPDIFYTLDVSDNESPEANVPRNGEAMDCTEPDTVDSMQSHEIKEQVNDESENINETSEQGEVIYELTKEACDQNGNDIEMECSSTDLSDDRKINKTNQDAEVENHQLDFSLSPGRLVIDLNRDFDETIPQNDVVYHQLPFGDQNDACNDSLDKTLVEETLDEITKLKETIPRNDVEHVQMHFENDVCNNLLEQNKTLVPETKEDDSIKKPEIITSDDPTNATLTSSYRVKIVSPAIPKNKTNFVGGVVKKSKKSFKKNLNDLLKLKETVSIVVEPNSSVNVSLNCNKHLDKKKSDALVIGNKNQLKASPAKNADASIGFRLIKDKHESFEKPTQKAAEREDPKSTPSKNKKDPRMVKSKEISKLNKDDESNSEQAKSLKEVKEAKKRCGSIESYKIPKKAKLDSTNDIVRTSSIPEPMRINNSQTNDRNQRRSNESLRTNRSSEKIKNIHNRKGSKNSRAKIKSFDHQKDNVVHWKSDDILKDGHIHESAKHKKDNFGDIKSDKISSIVRHKSMEHHKDNIVNLKSDQVSRDGLIHHASVEYKKNINTTDMKSVQSLKNFTVGTVEHPDNFSPSWPQGIMQFGSDHDSITEFIDILQSHHKAKEFRPSVTTTQTEEITRLYESIKNNCEDLETKRPSLRLLKCDDHDNETILHYGVLRLLRKKLNDALAETDLHCCDTSILYFLPKSLRFPEEEKKFTSLEGKCMIFKPDIVPNFNQLHLLEVLKNKINSMNERLENLKRIKMKDEFKKYFSIRGDLLQTRSLVLHELCCTDKHSAAIIQEQILKQLIWNGRLAELLFKSKSDQRLEFLQDIERETEILTECSAYLKSISF